MTAVGVGEKLGGRYFIIRAIAVVQPGAYFEVRDPLGAVATGQFLHEVPLPPESVEALRAEVVATPDRQGFFRPDAVMASTSGLPAAVFLRTVPAPLGARLPGLTLEGPVVARRWLIEAFARLAEDLSVAHAVRVVHGAIGLSVLLVTADDLAARMVLSGFGIEPAARAGTIRPRPTPRDDLAALALCLHEAFQQTRSEPDGPALTRWAVLRNCARGGDHPAFANGRVLAQHFRDLLPVDPPLRRVTAPVPGSSSATAPPGPPPAVTDVPGSPPFVPPPFAPREFPRRPAILALAGLVAVLAAGVTALVLHRAGEHHGSGGSTVTRLSRAGAQCGAESVTSPTGMDLPFAAVQLDAVCTHDRMHQGLLLLAHAGHTVVAGERQSTRGGVLSWGPVVVADGVREPGTAVSSPEGDWLAWRAEGPLPFGVARAGRTPTALTVSMPGWDGALFHGAFLLRASDTVAEVATTLSTPAGPVAVIVREDTRGDATAPATVYRVTDGEILAVEPGDPSVLLVASRDARGAVLHAVSVPVTSLPMLAAMAAAVEGANHGDGGDGSDGGGVHGSPRLLGLPAVSVQRLGEVVLPGEAVSAVPYGARRRFLVTAAGAGADGVVSLVSFPQAGTSAATAHTLSVHGHGLDLAGRADGGVLAVVAQSDGLELYLIDAGGDPVRARLTLPNADHVRAVVCGDETWVAYTTGQPHPRVAAVPLPCVSER